jgi:hypothetical protein
VARIGFQRHRAVLARLAQHAPRPAPPLSAELTTDSTRPRPTCLQRLRVQQPLHRGPDDGQRGHEDQHALEAAGEVLGLVVAVGVVVVGRRARPDVTMASANSAPARLTSDSSASDSRLTEPLTHQAPVFSAMVASATATDSFR